MNAYFNTNIWPTSNWFKGRQSTPEFYISYDITVWVITEFLFNFSYMYRHIVPHILTTGVEGQEEFVLSTEELP